MFPSGLAILIAIFSELNIQCMTLAGGALREGLVYGMLHLSVEQDIRSRTLRNIQRRFMIRHRTGPARRRPCQSSAQSVGWQLGAGSAKP